MWESVGAVEVFAGASGDRAVVEPVVSELLTRFDEHVTHYTLALAHHPPPRTEDL